MQQQGLNHILSMTAAAMPEDKLYMWHLHRLMKLCCIHAISVVFCLPSGKVTLWC